MKGEAPAGEMVDGLTLARPDFDAPEMPAAPQFLQITAFVLASCPSSGASEHDQKHDGNDGSHQQAVLGHVILFRGCFVDHTPGHLRCRSAITDILMKPGRPSHDT